MRSFGEVKDILGEYGQEHVLDFYNQLESCGHLPTNGLLHDVIFGYYDVYINKDWLPIKKQLHTQ